MQSKATTVKEYIETLAPERADAISAIRKSILKNLPDGLEEIMQYGMISYVIPHSVYPKGYHANPKHPLPYISLASQKNYISYYHMALYGELLEWFTKAYKKATVQKLDMGKCCVRFKKIEHIPVDLLGEAASKLTVKQWISIYEKSIK